MSYFTYKSRFLTHFPVFTGFKEFFLPPFLAIILINIFNCISVYPRELNYKPFKKCWENTTVTDKPPVASDNQKSLLILSGNLIQSINAVDGQINWSYEIGGGSISNFVLADNALYIANTIRNINIDKEQKENKKIYLRSINISSGIPFWATEVDLPLNGVKTQKETVKPNIDNDKIYVGAYGDNIFLLDSSGNLVSGQKHGGKLKWLEKFESEPNYFFDFNVSLNQTSSVTPPVFAFQASDKNIYFVSVQTGDIVRRIYRPETLTAAAPLAYRSLVTGDDKGNISLIAFQNEGKSKQVWKTKIGGGVSSLTSFNENILVTSFDNFIYLINQSKGKKIWKKRLSGRLLFKPLVVEVETEKLILVVENNVAYLIALNTGRLLDRILLAPDKYFTGTPISISNQYIFPTNSGLISFSDRAC